MLIPPPPNNAIPALASTLAIKGTALPYDAAEEDKETAEEDDEGRILLLPTGAATAAVATALLA